MSLLKERKEETSSLTSHTSWGAMKVTATAAPKVCANCLEAYGLRTNQWEVIMKLISKIQLWGNSCKLYIARNLRKVN
eukprot:6877511-Ditylum_brightwellii.AAC.1